MSGTKAGHPSVSRLCLKVDALRASAKERGWVTARQIAFGLGSSKSNVDRLLRGAPSAEGRLPQSPTGEFIAAVLVAFPDKSFDDFFAITRTTDALERAS